MDIGYKHVSWGAAAATAALYLVTLAIYRLVFHPLAKFPGPKLAAVTRYYEAYYDLVQNGRYSLKIAELHEKYGSIVRISPHELHINDPAYYEDLYNYNDHWDRYWWAVDAQQAPGAVITTVDHNLHKARRQPLNAYFSKARVAKHQVLIQDKIVRLCNRLDNFVTTKDTCDVGAAISALERDMSTEYVVGKDYRALDSQDFGSDLTFMMHGGGRIWIITKHLRWYGSILQSLPKKFIMKYGDKSTAHFMRFYLDNQNETKRLIEAERSPDRDVQAPSIVREIIRSSLPQREKEVDRVFADVATISGAGFETTAGVLRFVLYKIYSDVGILRRLRSEIDQTATNSADGDRVELRELEQLPYLTAVLKEALRFSCGVGTRLQRVAPDRDLVYDKWVIPSGTPVGMTTAILHMNEELFPDPKRFDPERWLGQDTKRMEKAYAPFSRGSRICLGMHFAWAGLYMTLFTLVQRYDFDFLGLSADHFDFVSDRFLLGTRGLSVLNAVISHRKPE